MNFLTYSNAITMFTVIIIIIIDTVIIIAIRSKKYKSFQKFRKNLNRYDLLGLITDFSVTKLLWSHLCVSRISKLISQWTWHIFWPSYHHGLIIFISYHNHPSLILSYFAKKLGSSIVPRIQQLSCFYFCSSFSSHEIFQLLK